METKEEMRQLILDMVNGGVATDEMVERFTAAVEKIARRVAQEENTATAAKSKKTTVKEQGDGN